MHRDKKLSKLQYRWLRSGRQPRAGDGFAAATIRCERNGDSHRSRWVGAARLISATDVYPIAGKGLASIVKSKDN